MASAAFILGFSSAQWLADWLVVIRRTVRVSPPNVEDAILVRSFPAIRIPSDAAAQFAPMNVHLKPHFSGHCRIGAQPPLPVRVSPKPATGLTAARDHLSFLSPPRQCRSPRHRTSPSRQQPAAATTFLTKPCHALAPPEPVQRCYGTRCRFVNRTKGLTFLSLADTALCRTVVAS